MSALALFSFPAVHIIFSSSLGAWFLVQVGRGGGTLECGFNCSTGWDPVTGMGTPKFGAMLKAAMAAVGVHV